MDAVIGFAATAVWLGLGALLGYRVLVAYREVESPPFLQVLERHGLSVTQAEEAFGLEAVATAVRRCASCSDRPACARVLALDWLGRQPPACVPNAGFFEQVKGTGPRQAWRR
jgi:hypothetical protein